MRDHNNRRRKRDYFSNVHSLANAMIKGDVEGTKLYFEAGDLSFFNLSFY